MAKGDKTRGLEATERVTPLGDPEPIRPDGPTMLESGDLVGRFRVVQELGRGAMGVVVLARDLDLDREVAVKLLRPQGGGSDGRPRLLREARAMARLDHPNVVTVYEVGAHGEGVFIAMEYAAGGTLRAAATSTHSWREVVDLHLRAGRGLWAAHRADLVHRDYKPDNVLLTRDGDVRVADFGLVGVDARSDSPDGPVTLGLTQTGALVGTPAYMSPEQHRREPATAASDQFAYCVTLYEALYGERPFAGETYAELADNVFAGRIRAAPRDSPVPARMRALLLRGLAVDPADRFPTMGELLDALGRAVDRRRRAWILTGVAAAALIAIGVPIGVAAWGDDAAGGCAASAASLDGVWDDAARAAVRRAFEGTGRPYAADSFDRVAARLDAYTGAWLDSRAATCRDYEQGAQTAAQRDLRLHCLDRRLSEVKALVEVLGAKSDAMVLDRSIGAVERLVDLGRCEDVAGLAGEPALPGDPEMRGRIAAVREQLAGASAHTHAGTFSIGLAVAEDAVRSAEEIGYEPLTAEALYRLGRLQEKMAQFAEAEASYRRAAVFAGKAQDDALLARIWTELILIVGNRLARPDDAVVLQEVATAAVARVPNEPEIAVRLEMNIAGVLNAQGHFSAAVEHNRRAIELARERLGSTHPYLAHATNNLGLAMGGSGDFDGAAEQFERALELYAKTLGTEHPTAAVFHSNLGLVRSRQYRQDEALEHFARALEIRERTLGADHVDVGLTLANIGACHVMGERYAEGEPYLERGLRIMEASLGKDHPKISFALESLTRIYLATDRPAEALAAAERTLSLRETAFGPNHTEVADALVFVAEALLARGKPVEALERAERAMRIKETVEGGPHEVALAQFTLARCLSRVGRDARRARALAEQAAETFAADGDERAGERVRAWLARTRR